MQKSTLAADKVAEKSNKLLETLRSGKRAIDEDIPADSEQTVKKMKMNTGKLIYCLDPTDVLTFAIPLLI